MHLSKLLKTALITLPLSFSAQSAETHGFEFSLDSSARSYSSGLSVTPMAAYKISLWGDQASPLEGAIRTKISSELSPATYSGKAELEFSPVTFINLSVGRKLLRRYSTFDEDLCKNNSCIGSLNSTDASIRALFMFGPIMGSLKYTKVFYDAKDDKTLRSIDPSTYTIISPDKEVADQIEAIVGTKLSDKWATGVLIQNVNLQKNDGYQNGQYLVLLKTNGHANYIAGAGRFESELKEAKPSFLFSFKYDWK